MTKMRIEKDENGDWEGGESRGGSGHNFKRIWNPTKP